MSGKAAVAEAKQNAPVATPVIERLGIDNTETHTTTEQREALHSVLQSPGDPLDPPTQRWAESRFDHSFSHVRVHTGRRAAESAASLESLAWTLGNHVAFGAGQFSPHTRDGRALIAHELTHVVQQRNARTAGDNPRVGPSDDAFEREAEAGPRAARSSVPTQRIQRASIFQKIWRFFGGEGTFEDDELQAYLKFLDDNRRIEDNFDSDNKARAVVRHWQAGRSAYVLSVDRRVLLLKEMLDGYVSDGDEKGILGILHGSMDVELAAIFKQVTPAQIRKKIGGDNLINFDYVITQYNNRATDVFAKTRPAGPTQHLVTEAVLNPGAVLVEAPPPPPKKEEPPKEEKAAEKEGAKPPEKAAPPPPPKKEPPPPPIFKDASAMTGLPPAPGVPGDFEKAMAAAIKAWIKRRGEIFRTNKKAGKTFPVDKAAPIAKAAQGATEDYFRPWLQVASRVPADPYHPRRYSLMSDIHDQSEVEITDDDRSPHPTRLGWVRYWMAQDDSSGKQVLAKYRCVTTRSPDKEEFLRVAGVIVADAANRADMDDTIHGWPAEATAGVNLQPYQDVSTPDKERTVRWDTYTTLLHEMMHIVQHPNYKRTYQLLKGSAQEILKEGMADVMRRDLWFGPGQLKVRLATDAYAKTREQIEGAKYDYKESVVLYHDDYPLEKDARKIVEGDGKHPGVGMPNAKAAFFLGHTDLLGIGEGTRGTAGALAGVANYHATDEKDAEVVIAQPGDTFESIRERTNAAPGGILDDTTGKPLKAADAIVDGTRLRIPGIRYVYTIQEDTLGSVAAQNRVDPARLAVANGLARESDVSHKWAPGTKVLIPIQQIGP
jgi:hypothetical protein